MYTNIAVFVFLKVCQTSARRNLLRIQTMKRSKWANLYLYYKRRYKWIAQVFRLRFDCVSIIPEVFRTRLFSDNLSTLHATFRNCHIRRMWRAIRYLPTARGKRESRISRPSKRPSFSRRRIEVRCLLIAGKTLHFTKLPEINRNYLTPDGAHNGRH